MEFIRQPVWGSMTAEGTIGRGYWDWITAPHTTTSGITLPLNTCPICHNQTHSLLRDANGNIMCPDCYKKLGK